MNLNFKSYKVLLIILSLFIGMILVSAYIFGPSYIPSISIITIAIIIYFIFANEDIFNPVAIYSLIWLGGIGISKLGLSYDQKSWSLYVWLNMILAYIMFILGYYYVSKKDNFLMTLRKKRYKYSNERLYLSIIILALICIFAFLIEVAVLKFIPLFSDKMDAYKRFHITGIHYFVVTVGIIPSLTMIYKKNGGSKKTWFINLFAIIIPILIVSRQLILLEVLLIVITYHYLFKRLSIKKILIIGFISILAFSLVSILRHQNLSYLNKVSHMKATKLSFLTQPYLYVAMSFENLRNIIEEFHSYKFGVNMLFPIFAFTNTKGFFNYSYKVDYLTNKFFTVSTYLSDIYFDFGIFGVVILTFILGGLHSYIYKFVIRKHYNMLPFHLILSYCLIFSFFTTWYFNATIWFYGLVLLGINLFCDTSESTKINKIIKKVEIFLKGIF